MRRMNNQLDLVCINSVHFMPFTCATASRLSLFVLTPCIPPFLVAMVTDTTDCEFGIFMAILSSVLVAFLLKSQATVETLLLSQRYLPTDPTLRAHWVVYPWGRSHTCTSEPYLVPPYLPAL